MPTDEHRELSFRIVFAGGSGYQRIVVFGTVWGRLGTSIDLLRGPILTLRPHLFLGYLFDIYRKLTRWYFALEPLATVFRGARL